jgi:ParB/RepB/Spo0J family partition protein
LFRKTGTMNSVLLWKNGRMFRKTGIYRQGQASCFITVGVKIVELNLDALELSYENLRARSLEQEKRLLASLGELGQQSPVIVVNAGDPGRYAVIDGHKRVRALKKLKADTAKAVLWEAPAPQALISVYQMRQGSGYNPLEEGWLIEELCRGLGWSLGQAASALGRSKGWASRRLGLVESLPEAVLDGVQKGKIGSYAAMKHLLPLARANVQDCEKLSLKIIEHSLTSRQVEILYSHYKASSRPQAQKILEDPMLFLKAKEGAALGAQDPHLTPPENRALNNLKLLGSVSLGLARSLGDVLGYDAAEAARAKIYQAWTGTWERLRLLEKTGVGLFAKEQAHAG